jgi:hypothetical protein
MAAITAMIAETTYPVSAPTSDPCEPDREQVGDSEHPGETQQHQKVERHCLQYCRPAVNDPLTLEGRLLVKAERGAGLVSQGDSGKELVACHLGAGLGEQKVEA